MNTAVIVDDILDREGPGTPPYLAKNDAGGRTAWGVSERAHPECWRPGPPTKATARALIVSAYIAPFIAFAPWARDDLMAAIVDDAVMSGVSAATKRLQWVLGVEMDGTVGPVTIEAVKQQAGARLQQRYVVERAVRAARIVQIRPADATNITGWITRILKFLPVPGRDA